MKLKKIIKICKTFESCCTGCPLHVCIEEDDCLLQTTDAWKIDIEHLKKQIRDYEAKIKQTMPINVLEGEWRFKKSTPEIDKEFQELLFQCGGEWISGVVICKTNNEPNYYLYGGKLLTSSEKLKPKKCVITIEKAIQSLKDHLVKTESVTPNKSKPPKWFGHGKMFMHNECGVWSTGLVDYVANNRVITVDRTTLFGSEVIAPVDAVLLGTVYSVEVPVVASCTVAYLLDTYDLSDVPGYYYEK